MKDVHFQCLHFRDDADNSHQLGGDHKQLLACVQTLQRGEERPHSPSPPTGTDTERVPASEPP